MVHEAVVGISLGAISLWFLYYIFLVIPTKWVRVAKNQYDLGIGIKALQISDLHVERLRVMPSKIKQVIEKENPDYIFLTGDFLDTREAFEKLEQYLEIVRYTNIPTYAVLGNHDYYLDDTEELKDLLTAYGVKLLLNDHVDLGGFVLVGIDDYGSQLSNPIKAFEGVGDKKPVIVLTHDPNLVLAMKESFDYLLSGHLHGKQLNIPFLFQIMPMGDLPKTGIYKGEHQSQYGTYYISKGLGQTGWNIRFLVRSEMTLHEF